MAHQLGQAIIRREFNMKHEIGEIIKLKKQHPCGSNEWEVLRSGVDYRIKCLGCGHILLIPRIKIEKMIKN